MKHRFLRFISVLLCGALLCGTMCFAGMTADLSGTCGEDITWALDVDSYTLTLTGSGKMEEYNLSSYSQRKEPPWMYQKSKIHKIVMDDRIETISQYAFQSCTALQTIHLPLALQSIGYVAFSGCKSLTAVELPPALQTIAGGAFEKSGLRSLSIPSGMEKIEIYAFRECASLQSIEFADGISCIGTKAFENCTALQTVQFPDSLKRLEDSAFKGCTALKSVVLNPSLSYVNCDIFTGCTALTDATLGGSDCTYGSTFSGCTALRRVTIRQGTTKLGSSMFKGCTALSEITIPDSVYSVDVNAISDTAFWNDEENWDGATLYCGAALLSADKSVQSFTVREGTSCIGAGVFSDAAALTDVRLPDSLLGLSYAAFKNCTALEAITLPDRLCFIGSSAFDGCTALEGIELPGSVRYIEKQAFRNCSKIRSILLPDGVTDIPYGIFMGCTSLEHLELPDSVVRFDSWIIGGCTKLRSLRLPAKLEYMEQNALTSAMFTHIELPETLTNIPEEAFAGCANLKSIYIPASVKSIWFSAFDECSSLRVICYGGEDLRQWETTTCGQHLPVNVGLVFHKHNTDTPTGRVGAVPPTCTQSGYSGDLCYLPCGVPIEEGTSVPALGHDYSAVVIDPTCENKGYTTYTCTRCGDNYITDEIPSTGRHTWDDGTVTTEPTCTANGVKTFVCTACGSTRTESADALGHSFGDWTTTVAPTEYTEGAEKRVCTRCGEEETRSVPSLAETKLTLNHTQLTLIYKRSEETLTASENVTWTSSNEKAVKVDANGHLKTVRRGTATITARSVQGGKTATCTVTVKYLWWQWLIKIFLFGFIWY